METSFTKQFKTYQTSKGFSFAFYCDLCDRPVITEEYITTSYLEALKKAQVDAKRYFNKCHQCGKWICDEHYNEDNMRCIKCSPRKDCKL